MDSCSNARMTVPVLGKFSRRQNRIGNTTPKRMNRRYYKGKGARKGGTVNSKGIFVADVSKRMTIVPPENLAEFKLGPYVDPAVDSSTGSEEIATA